MAELTFAFLLILSGVAYVAACNNYGGRERSIQVARNAGSIGIFSLLSMLIVGSWSPQDAKDIFFGIGVAAALVVAGSGVAEAVYHRVRKLSSRTMWAVNVTLAFATLGFLLML